MQEILKVLVGSHAHGLATETSDYDFRGVFVQPTSEILKLGSVKKHTSWNEGAIDDTSWELGHFLEMATKSNPTVLETFLAPVVNPDPEMARPFGMPFPADELRALFPHVWNSNDVVNAFVGYSHNQRKKFLDKKDDRAPKYAAAAARTLYNAHELLTTGTFTIRIADTPVGETVRRFKAGDYTVGEVMQHIEEWENKVKAAFKECTPHETNLEAVNEFLLKVRKANW